MFESRGKNSTVWFVSRHPGAKDWAKMEKLPIDRWVEELPVDEIKQGDIVIGSLPMHLAAKVCKIGAEFYALTFTIERSARGKELDVHKLQQCMCELVHFDVREVKENR